MNEINFSLTSVLILAESWLSLSRLGISPTNQGQVVLRQPRVSVKSAFSSESCKRKFSIIPFVNNLMIECPNKNKGNYLKKA